MRGGRLEKRRLYPSKRVLRTHWLALILVHSAEKAESLTHIGGRDWAEIGGLEGWLRHPDRGGEQKSGMFLYKCQGKPWEVSYNVLQ